MAGKFQSIKVSPDRFKLLSSLRRYMDRKVVGIKASASWGEFFMRCAMQEYGVATALAQVPDRPTVLESITHQIETGHGRIYLTVSYKDGKIIETFGAMGHTNPCVRAEVETICRLVSVMLRCGIGKSVIVGQLVNIKCDHPGWDNGEMVHSVGDAIAQVLREVD